MTEMLVKALAKIKQLQTEQQDALAALRARAKINNFPF